MDAVSAAVLAVCLLLMLGSVLGILAVDRRALTPALLTAALLVTVGGYVAFLFTL